MRVRSQEGGGATTKDLIVLLGDSHGLHGRWPGNGYSYREVCAETHMRLLIPRESLLENGIRSHWWLAAATFWVRA